VVSLPRPEVVNLTGASTLWFAVEKVPKKNDKESYENGAVWILAGEVDDFRTDTDKIDPLSNKITKIFRSTVISRRISAQTGVFTVHRVNKDGRMIKFETNANFKKKLSKLIIPFKNFVKIRKQLNILGVNNATLFPDMDGFCKHLTWRFSKYEDERAI